MEQRTTIEKKDISQEMHQRLVNIVSPHIDLDSLDSTETLEARINLDAREAREQYILGNINDDYIAGFDLFKKTEVEIIITLLEHEVQKVVITDTWY